MVTVVSNVYLGVVQENLKSTNKLEPSRRTYQIAQAYSIHSFILFSAICIGKVTIRTTYLKTTSKTLFIVPTKCVRMFQRINGDYFLNQRQTH
jgi:hypothetical protein